MMATKHMPIIDWLQIEASAPAKFIISGEYSVVYEKQAIAATIDLRTKVVIKPNTDGKIRLNLKNLNQFREWPSTSLNMCRLVSKYSDCLDFNENMPIKLNDLLHTRYHVTKTPTITPEKESNFTKEAAEKKANDAALAFLLLYIGLGDSYASSARPSIDVVVDSEIPVGAGLGSSSALSIALCGALMRVFRVVAEKYIISNWAFNIDKFFHGKPSGVDNNIISSGGYILFQNGKIKSNGIEHKSPIKVMLIDTGVSRSTKTLSEGVVKQLNDEPAKVNSIFNNINELTTQIWRRMNDPNFAPKSISGYLGANQELLDSLGVGHEKLNDIFARAQLLNLRAKQTGAGGGGIAFVLYDQSDNCKHLTQLRDELKEAGYKIYDHTIGCDGLIVKITADPDRRFVLGDK